MPAREWLGGITRVSPRTRPGSERNAFKASFYHTTEYVQYMLVSTFCMFCILTGYTTAADTCRNTELAELVM